MKGKGPRGRRRHGNIRDPSTDTLEKCVKLLFSRRWGSSRCLMESQGPRVWIVRKGEGAHRDKCVRTRRHPLVLEDT